MNKKGIALGVAGLFILILSMGFGSAYHYNDYYHYRDGYFDSYSYTS